jgi:superfamily II DNA/RNA helicase
MTFESLSLNPFILKALEEAGYSTPTPIQAAAIPLVLEGHDLIASAQTGTGKTAAFVLPALHKICDAPKGPGKGPRMLVLSPTRELAQQITDASTKYGKHMRRAKCVSILGGTPYHVQNRLLASPVDILVATPGRLLDHMQRGKIDFSRLEILVLDEADRMLDMGFIEDVETIARATPQTRQTLLFSATMDARLAKLASALLKEPKRIEMASQREKNTNIAQHLHYCDDVGHKTRILDHLLRDIDLNQAIVFTATKRDADSLAETLYQQGFPAAALHGDMHQSARNRTLNKLRRGELKVLVATDVAARGIDVPGITHVVNYDLPKIAEDYVHRIGRTGRAGASGTAVSLVSARDSMQLRRIKSYTGQEIPAQVIPGLEPKVAVHRDRPSPSGKNRPQREGSWGNKAPSEGYRGKRESSWGNKAPTEGFRAKRDFGAKPAAATGFAGPSERRQQERYAPQPGAFKSGNEPGGRDSKPSGRPARKFDR